VSDLWGLASKFAGTLRALRVVQNPRENLPFCIRCIRLKLVPAAAVIQDQITTRTVVVDCAVKTCVFRLEIDATAGCGRFDVARRAPVDVLGSQLVILQVDGPAPLEADVVDRARVAWGNYDFVASLVPAGEEACVFAVALGDGHGVWHCDSGSGQGEKEGGLRMHIQVFRGSKVMREVRCFVVVRTVFVAELLMMASANARCRCLYIARRCYEASMTISLSSSVTLPPYTDTPSTCTGVQPSVIVR
jgi:hypothetical protein